MKVRKTMWRCAAAIAIGLVSMTSQVAPASADPGYVQLNNTTLSPQYLVNGCRYKIIYGNFGSASFAGVRLYGGCSDVTVGLRSINGPTPIWTWSSTVAGTGTDTCGAYTAIQENGPNPAYGIGAYILATGTTGAFWKFYDADGDQTQPIHSTC